MQRSHIRDKAGATWRPSVERSEGGTVHTSKLHSSITEQEEEKTEADCWLLSLPGPDLNGTENSFAWGVCVCLFFFSSRRDGRL